MTRLPKGPKGPSGLQDKLDNYLFRPIGFIFIVVFFLLLFIAALGG